MLRRTTALFLLLLFTPMAVAGNGLSLSYCLCLESFATKADCCEQPPQGSCCDGHHDAESLDEPCGDCHINVHYETDDFLTSDSLAKQLQPTAALPAPSDEYVLFQSLRQIAQLSFAQLSLPPPDGPPLYLRHATFLI